MKVLWCDDLNFDSIYQARTTGHLLYENLQLLILEIGSHLHESRNQFTVYNTCQLPLNIHQLLLSMELLQNPQNQNLHHLDYHLLLFQKIIFRTLTFFQILMVRKQKKSFIDNWKNSIWNYQQMKSGMLNR